MRTSLPAFISLTLPLLLGACAEAHREAIIRQGSRVQAERLPAQGGARPNIILIVADDLGYGDTGPYGQDRVATPNIDALAAGGVTFTQHYAASPVCAPSRAALLTGKHTGHSQIRGNYELGDYTDAGERGQMPLAVGTPTLSGALKSAGYRTAAIGKWGLGGPGSEGVPFRHGFDYFFGYLDQKQAHNYYPTHLWENERRVPLRNRFFIPHARYAGTSERAEDYQFYLGQDYAPDRLIEKAEAFISQSGADPFFLYYAPVLPHAAMQVPDEALKRHIGRWPETPLHDGDYTPHPYPRSARAAMVTRLDEEVGRLVARVRRAGLAENTLILFSSDNGPSTEGGEDIAFFDATAALRGMKRELYEGGIRVPLIAYWPGRIGAGRRSDFLCAGWDLMPTLAEIGRAKLTGPVDGISIAPSLVAAGHQREHSHLYWEFHGGTGGAQAVRQGRWKAIRRQPNGFNPRQTIELYDLEKDPGERSDVAAQHPAVVARLATLLNSRTRSPQRGFNFDPAP